FANRKRLGDVVVRSQFESDNFVHFLPARRQHNDGNRNPLGLELLADIQAAHTRHQDRKSTRLNSSHGSISYAVFCLKKKKINMRKIPKKRSIIERYRRQNDLETQEFVNNLTHYN